jgi:hypothetical protein
MKKNDLVEIINNKLKLFLKRGHEMSFQELENEEKKLTAITEKYSTYHSDEDLKVISDLKLKIMDRINLSGSSRAGAASMSRSMNPEVESRWKRS